ncbi:uncharacterized protein LOC133199837 [Saccostrea echinata]|uniref:uncharacterized protein LOC133199837 n=1 Tax=Saccostrea echinata TaxID=191078 RepID=UPI002A80FB8D|nr:uncharacterized protein LOC133199837 [Saccostrea echinata]
MALGIRGDLSYAFSWTLFFVRILRYDSLTLWPVDSCPRNQSEVEAATLRLNCSDVKESVNVYHCLPFSNLSGLVEFCLDGFSGLIEAGNCMVLSRDTLDDHPCDHFTNGCPNANYLSKNMYNYPACLKINPQNNCYIADPRCPNERFLKTTAMSTITSSEKETIKLTYTATDNKSLLVEATSIPALNGNDNPRLLYLIPVSLGVLLLLVAIALVILWNRRRSKRARKDKHQESEEGLHLMSDEDDPMNEMHTCLEDEEFLERYKIYLEEGSVEVCPISQIIIVGEHEVGKTTLLYRLQGKSRKEIEAIKSTRGIECHTEEHSFIITKNQLEMNLKGVNSFSVDPGHVSRFSKDLEKKGY